MVAFFCVLQKYDVFSQIHIKKVNKKRLKLVKYKKNNLKSINKIKALQLFKKIIKK